ncbi:putative insertion element transposase [Neisseria zoodegmatis]|uniref:Putative insertion element transposase n=1 Tax=Neisseria zoodegmatis TaxID=326523 RepID=A0A378WHZ1_9NEIS|nr:putative insertion element transposase [Neisseria zoodegmatis]
MELKNKYQKFSKITKLKFRQTLRFFSLNLTVSDTAKLTGISVRNINSLYLKLNVQFLQLQIIQAVFFGYSSSLTYSGLSLLQQPIMTANLRQSPSSLKTAIEI